MHQLKASLPFLSFLFGSVLMISCKTSHLHAFYPESIGAHDENILIVKGGGRHGGHHYAGHHHGHHHGHHGGHHRWNGNGYGYAENHWNHNYWHGHAWDGNPGYYYDPNYYYNVRSVPSVQYEVPATTYYFNHNYSQAPDYQYYVPAK